jgi:putative ABC transport system permease protein
MTFQVNTWSSRYGGPDRGRIDLFYRPLFRRLAAIPGVTSVAGTSSLPLTGIVGMAGSILGPVQIDDSPISEGWMRPNFLTIDVTPGYFETMGIPILAGRGFVDADCSPGFSETAFVISASVKRKYWPNQSALGQRLTSGRLNGPVIGVVGDEHHRGLELPAEETIYSSQIIGRTLMLAVRTAVDPNLVVPAIQVAVAEIDSEVPVIRVRTMRDILGDSLNRTSFTMKLLVLAAGIALFLSAIGIYRVVSYVSSQQSTEMGVRFTFGADPGRVRNLILSRGLLLTGLGALLGLAGSAALGSVLSSLLFAVSPLDLRTLVGASVLLLCVAALSSLIPTRRAARTSLAVALRAEG